MSNLKESTQKLIRRARMRKELRGDPGRRKYIADTIRKGRKLIGGKAHRSMFLD